MALCVKVKGATTCAVKYTPRNDGEAKQSQGITDSPKVVDASGLLLTGDHSYSIENQFFKAGY